MSEKNFDENTYEMIIGFMALGIIILIAVVYFMINDKQKNITSSPTSQAVQKTSTTKCKDVTSYDHNWNNDVLCTRPDGSTFYTDYAGGNTNDPEFSR